MLSLSTSLPPWSRTSALSLTGPSRTSSFPPPRPFILVSPLLPLPSHFPPILTLPRSHSHNPSYLASLLAELYVARSAPLWKDPVSTAWLRKTVNEVAPLLDDRANEDVSVGEELWTKGAWPEGVAPEGVIRAAFMSGSSRLPLLFPLSFYFSRSCCRSPGSGTT